MERRAFLLQSAGLFALVKTGLIWSRQSWATVKGWTKWPASWSEETPLEQSIRTVFADRKMTPSDQIQIDMPPGAENGAIISITIKTDLPEVNSISIFGEKNPVPLIGQFRFMQNGQGNYLRSRIKLAESSEVMVIVESAGELYSAKRYIEVLKGGCD